MPGVLVHLMDKLFKLGRLLQCTDFPI